MTHAAVTRDEAARAVTVRGLTVEGPAGTIVQPLDLDITAGTTLAIIGESGSGKTMTARAITGLLPRGTAAEGEMRIDGDSFDLASTAESDWAEIRGRRVVLLLQDPFTSLSPVIRCGEQIAATIRARARHAGTKLSKAELATEVTRRLAEVHLPAEVARRFPSELSGGMRQRVAIAAALAAEPRLLIADEPTTALDASNQGEVLDLLRELQRTHEMCVLLISHDLGIVSGRADELVVMRGGEVVERGRTDAVLSDPRHAYTRALLAANPSVTDAGDGRGSVSPTAPAVLSARGIAKRFGSRTVLSNAEVDVAAGEIVALVGESGSGKSTFARCIAGLDVPDAGTVTLGGRQLSAGRRGRKPGEMQIVFQDPYSTLNPAFTIGRSLIEALAAVGRPASDLDELMRLVELDPTFASRRPAQLSGGQRQRVAIARALAPNPELLICDESVSALDVSVQAQILELLTRLRDSFGLAILFITHDLGVVARVAARTVVLQSGNIVESGATEQVLRAPAHPYTQMLVAAAERESVAASAVAPSPTASKEH